MYDESARTIWDTFCDFAQANPELPALVDLSSPTPQWISYAELQDRALRTSAALAGLGVRRGDAVATLLPNCREWVETFLAAARIGALVVPLNTRYRTEEISHLLRLAKAEILVTASEFQGIDFASRLHSIAALPAEEAVGLTHVVNVAGDITALPTSWNPVAAGGFAGCAVPSFDAGAQADDPLIVFGTSGTTSAPKLAVHTHRTTSQQVKAVADRMMFDRGSAALQVLSLSGTFGFVPFLAGLLVGKPTVLLPIFKRAQVLDALSQYDCELLVAAEGSVRELLDNMTGDTAGGLRRIVTAGLEIGDIVEAAARSEIKAYNVYGSSEVFAFSAMADPGAPAEERQIPGGRLTAPGTAVRVRDPKSGELLGIGEVGELEIGGATVFVEYLRNEEATFKAKSDDGWFRTGDSATLLDARSFRYLARANDTLRLGGYSVSPADVESTIEQLPGVAQALVVGVRDGRTGDDSGVAFVKVRDGYDVTSVDVIDHCRSRLASFKVPVHVEIVDGYPTTPSANGDKVRRDKLRELAADFVARQKEHIDV